MSRANLCVLRDVRLRNGGLALAFAGAGRWHAGPKSTNSFFERPIGWTLHTDAHSMIACGACKIFVIFRCSIYHEPLDALQAKRVPATRQEVRGAHLQLAIVVASADYAGKQIARLDGAWARGLWIVGDGLVRVRWDLRHCCFWFAEAARKPVQKMQLFVSSASQPLQNSRFLLPS